MTADTSGTVRRRLAEFRGWPRDYADAAKECLRESYSAAELDNLTAVDLLVREANVWALLAIASSRNVQDLGEVL